MNDLKSVTVEYYGLWDDEFILASNITGRKSVIMALAYIIRLVLNVDGKISDDQFEYAVKRIGDELVRKGITTI